MLNQDETIFEGNDPIITSVESMSHITIEKAEERMNRAVYGMGR